MYDLFVDSVEWINAGDWNHSVPCGIFSFPTGCNLWVHDIVPDKCSASMANCDFADITGKELYASDHTDQRTWPSAANILGSLLRVTKLDPA